MLRGVDPEDVAALAQLRAEASATQPVVAEVPAADDDAYGLPRDRVQWIKDAIAVSRAARELVARLRPLAIHVRTVWDHRFRTIAIAGHRLSVDASGSYRLGL